MSWATQATEWPKAVASNPLDALDQDALLTLWQQKKDAIEAAKTAEMDLRKYIVNRAFPQKHEGTNTLELGAGYQLKANVKLNYRLADNATVEATLNEIEKTGNEGQFIADRLVSCLLYTSPSPRDRQKSRM